MKSVKTLIFLMLSLALFITGCSKEQSLGEALPENTKITPLAELLSSPAKYHEKKVVLDGVVSGQCGNRCEFTYSESGKATTIYMGSIEAPVIKTGTPVRVAVDVFNGESQVILTASGFTLKTKEAK